MLCSDCSGVLQQVPSNTDVTSDLWGNRRSLNQCSPFALHIASADMLLPCTCLRLVRGGPPTCCSLFPLAHNLHMQGLLRKVSLWSGCLASTTMPHHTDTDTEQAADMLDRLHPGEAAWKRWLQHPLLLSLLSCPPGHAVEAAPPGRSCLGLAREGRRTLSSRWSFLRLRPAAQGGLA